MSDSTIAAVVPWQGIAFSVLGKPAPQGSKRAFVVKGHAVLTEDSKRSAPWRDSVAAAARDAMNGHLPIDDAVDVSVTFDFIRPKSSKREYPSVIPDVDKLLRTVLDGLTAGGALRDDARVVNVTARKRYRDFEGAQVTVRLTPPEAWAA